MAFTHACIAVMSVGLCAASLSACVSAPKASLSAEWLTPACEFPARFRVELRNVSDEPFAVLADQALGYGQPINFVAALEADASRQSWISTFSSESIFGPPPHLTNLVDLESGETQTYELEFDGVFDVHGGDGAHEGRWHGQLQFFYLLPSRIVEAASAHSPAILSGRDEFTRSNTLECP